MLGLTSGDVLREFWAQHGVGGGSLPLRVGAELFSLLRHRRDKMEVAGR